MTGRFRGPRPFLTAAISVLIGAMLFAACGGSVAGSPTTAPAATLSTPAAASIGAGGSSSTDTTGTCGLVTAEAVGKAAGFVVAASSGAPGTCIFQNADKTKDMAVQQFDNQAAMATTLSIESGGEHVANLGDDAFWVPQLGLLFARKGDHAIQFTDPDLGTDPTNTATRDALVALAQTALPKI
jgi:hypothetical protein